MAGRPGKPGRLLQRLRREAMAFGAYGWGNVWVDEEAPDRRRWVLDVAGLLNLAWWGRSKSNLGRLSEDLIDG